MFKSLYSKLAAVLTALFVLVGLAFLVLTLFSTDMYQQEVNQKLNSHLAQQIVREKLLMRGQEVNQEALKEIFHMLMVVNPAIEIYLLDIRGNILAYSAEPGAVKRSRIDLVPVRACLKMEKPMPILGDDPRNLDGQKVFSAARIPEKGELQGYLYVILGGEKYDSVAQKLKTSHILKLSSWMIGASLLFALITGLLLFASLTGRLKKLTVVMDAFKSGDKLDKLDLPSLTDKKQVDEIERLGTTFKKMAERIETQMESLVQSDTTRRELIANVSHDLRTPLATLQGYIETLLVKDDHLQDSDRKEYLGIALKHCDHLSNLVNRLLELATLESPGMRVTREPFNLGELLHDVVQKFQLTTQEKSIRVGVHADEGLPFVNADIGLIERVLENLIENAVRHTPKDGEVRLLLTLLTDTIQMEISDTGPGIPESVLPLIFNRFHQLEESRRLNPGHTGLGLAITKKILDLHSSDIAVSSTAGSGTSFRFQLPIYHPNV